MATLDIGGKKVTVDDSFLSLPPDEQNKAVDEIAHSIGTSLQPDPLASQLSQMTQDAGNRVDYNQADTNIRANMEARKIDSYFSHNAMTDAAVSADPFLGWGDELWSNTVGAGTRMMRDGVGYSEAAKREQALQDALKRNREDRSPIASTVGSLAGGMATGGGLMKGGVTLAGRSIPFMGRTLPAMLEAGTYGAVQGSGDAAQGDKLAGAGRGAVIAAATGGLLSKAGDMIGNRLAAKAAANAPAASDVLKKEAGVVYDQAYKSGTVIKPAGVKKIVDNMTLAAGRPNVNSRPNTYGMIQDLNAMRGKPLDVEAFHELRKQVNAAIKGAVSGGEDAMRLTRMKTVLDGAERWLDVRHVTNGKSGMELLAKANEIYSRAAKTGKIEQLSELAKLKSGNFTQAGEGRAVSQQAQGLAADIIRNGSQGFKPEEVALLNKIAMGQTSGNLARNVAKYAPRGVVSGGVSSTLGATIGGFVGGPAGSVAGAVGLPLAARSVAKSVDKAAISAIARLEAMVASGNASPALRKVINPLSKYAVPSAIAASKMLPMRQQLQSPQAQR